MTSEDLVYWEILEQMEPFGERAQYIRNAMVCALIVNSNRGPNSTPATMDDFLPATLRSRQPDSGEPVASDGEAANPEAIRAIMSALMMKQNQWIASQEGGAHA